MKTVTITYSIQTEGGCPSHTRTVKVQSFYYWGFESLQVAFNEAIELYELRQKERARLFAAEEDSK